jgi:hypothetical protein
MEATSDAVGMPELEVRGGDEGWLATTPWWMISAGLHLVLLLVATLFYVERFTSVDSPPIGIQYERSHGLLEDQGPSVDKFIREHLVKDDVTAPVEEHFVFDPTATLGNHMESDDNEEFHMRKGESEKLHGYIPGGVPGILGRTAGQSPGTTDIMGVGPGGGRSGRYGTRFGGKKNLITAYFPGGPDTESAVTAALKWLARHQNPDGSWGARSFSDQCVGTKCSGPGDAEHDTGVTGLSLLAFLGAGYTHLSKDEYPDPLVPGRKLRFGDAVKNGLKWLLSKQDTEGCIGSRGTKFMYNHTIAALALSEAYGMSATQHFKGPAQMAVDFVLAAQNPDRAWRYTKQPGDNDSSVTGWAIMALKSAELSELQVPTRESYEKAKKWFDEATNPSGYYRVGYNARASGPVYIPGVNENFKHHESMTAVGVLCRIFMSKDKKDPTLGGVQLLVSDLPAWKPDLIDYYYWYYASLALFQYDAPNGPYWKKWNEAMKDALVPNQKTAKDGCANGSWTSENERWGAEGGRVYAVAINALTLEVYYRYPNIIGGTK